MRADFRRSEAGREREDLQLFAKKAAIFILLVLGVILLWHVRRILILLFIAGVLASGIAPAVRRVRTWVRHYTGRRIKRGTAVLLVYLPFLAAAVAVLVFGVPILLHESADLAAQLPKLIDEKLLTPLGATMPVGPMRDMLFRDWKGEVPVFGVFRRGITLVASAVAVLVLIAYMLIDSERIRNIFLLFYPPEKRAGKQRMIRRASRRMSSWLSGQLILAAIVGTATLVGLLALRIPYAVPLALVAAVGEMVPVIGPIIGAVPALVIALFQSTPQFWAVLVMAILIQQVENLFLVPRLMGRKVSVSPLAVLVAFMIGGTLLGIIGAIMAIPAVAIIQVAFEEAFVARRERRLDGTRPGTLARTDQE